MAKRNWADGVLGNTPLSAARLNTLESDLSAALAALARDPESLFAGAVQYDSNGAPTSAVVKWPDGMDGTYSGTPSDNFPGSISAYTITRVVGGSTITYTQPRITRDAATGNVTDRPPIIVSGDTVSEYLYPDPVQPSSLDTAVAGKINDTSSDTRAALNALYAPAGTVGTSATFLDVRDYGAIGDGVADDTAAAQAWLDAGGAYLRDVTLRITAGLTLSGDKRVLFMDNAKIICSTLDTTALTITGNNCRVRVHIDGGNNANYGIKANGLGLIVEDSIIENIYSTTFTARGIEVTTTNGCTIRNNIIRNVYSAGDATLGNNSGSARAIILTATTAATVKSEILGNIISDVTGEEGDAVQVLFAGTGIYPDANVTIAGNRIHNVSRRFIKIQGSTCRVLENTLTHDGAATPANPGNAIDVIQSDNVLVAGNTIGPNPLLVAINAVGAAGSVPKNVIVRDNTVRQSDTKAYAAIYGNYLNESAIQTNTVYGGAGAVSVGNSTSVLIQGNSHFGGASGTASFNANSSNTGVVMRLNVNMLPARTTAVTNTSTGGLTELNASRV